LVPCRVLGKPLLTPNHSIAIVSSYEPFEVRYFRTFKEASTEARQHRLSLAAENIVKAIVQKEFRIIS
jgi:hypothetical protein